MKIEQLRYFLETARQQHIGRAAKALAISPSAISHSIAALEEELGRELFSKRGKNIVLTDHGVALMDRTVRILEELSRLESELRAEGAELRGHQRIAATHYLCTKVLAPAWARLHAEHTSLSCEMFTLRSSDVVNSVATGQVDWGLCFNPHERPDVERRAIHQGRLVIAFRKGHPALAKKGAFGAKLQKYQAVLPKAFAGIEICETHPAFDRHGIQVKLQCTIDSYETALELVATSDAWSLIPDWIVRSDSRLRALSSPSDWDAGYVICEVWPKNRPPGRVLGELARGCRQSLTATAGSPRLH